MHSIVVSNRVVRQWHTMYETIVGIGMMTNTMILCCNKALHKENWVSISRLQQPLWRGIPSNKFAIFLVAMRRSLWIQKHDRFSFLSWEYCTLPCLQTFNWPSLVTSRPYLLEECFCYRQGAGCTLGSAASKLHVRWESQVSLSSAVSVARCCLQQACCLSSHLTPLSSSHQHS